MNLDEPRFTWSDKLILVVFGVLAIVFVETMAKVVFWWSILRGCW